MVHQGKSQSHMHIPPPGMIRNPGSHFDQTIDPPFDGPLHVLVPYIEPVDHLTQLVSHNLHLQIWLGNLEALATLPSPYREVVITAETVEKAISTRGIFLLMGWFLD